MTDPAAPKQSGLARTLAILACVSVFLVAVIAGMAIFLNKPGPERTRAAERPADPPELINAGRQVTVKYGCITCHSDDGSIVRGPSYKGLFNSTQNYTDGTSGVIDEADVRDALLHPNAKIIDGFEPQMPVFKNVSDEDKTALVAYLRSIGKGK